MGYFTIICLLRATIETELVRELSVSEDESLVEQIQQTANVPIALSHLRLDQIAAQLFPDFSRGKLQAWIKSGHLTVNGHIAHVRSKLVGDELLALNVTPEPQGHWVATKMALDIVFEDTHLLVINKPVGLVVHPAAGHHSDTLVNGVLAYLPTNEQLPRGGIVHRLDKDTSGIMVVAKSLKAQQHLVQQLQTRSMGREYHAITQRQLVSGGCINAPIARHPNQRTRMSVRDGGKSAVTHYSLLHKFAAHTHIRVKLETGRTHQIRVHMAHIGFPLVGDVAYAGRKHVSKGLSVNARTYIQHFKRQALHAKTLRLIHPQSQEPQVFDCPLAADFCELLEVLGENEKL